MLKENLLQIYQQSFRDNWSLPALTAYGTGSTLTYSDLARRISRMHATFKAAGIKQGDKIALMGKNSIEWVQLYMGVITYGAVIVPVLNEFSATDAQHIINHSDARLLWVDESIWNRDMDITSMPQIRAVMALEPKARVLAEQGLNMEKVLANADKAWRKTYAGGFNPDDIVYPQLPPDSLAEINYTSGTTGFSKGVMLTLNNLAGNVVFGINSRLHRRGTRALAFLPFAHAYGCAFDMLTTLAVGSHITVLGRLPSPAVIVKAMNEVKPDLIISVPLVLEKIYRKQLQPLLKKASFRGMMKIPGFRQVLYRKIRSKLVNAFGGKFEQVIVGGAPLNAEVEEFLRRIRFPFTVGYGMTECGPLISYTYWRDFQPFSSGQTLVGYMESKIDGSLDPENAPGEICVRGENVMTGYYKNPDATAAAIDDDGWLHTGDMGTRSADGTIFIKGRYKTMILAANGQNIYPEEIEAKLNNMTYVNESLVVERGNKLVALVYPDLEVMDRDGVAYEALQPHMDKNLEELNRIVAPYERIAEIRLVGSEFEKTPKKSIKRFLYS